MCAICRLRSELGLPRRVLLEDYDRALAVDFSNILSVESFVQSIATLNHVSLVEMFADPGDQCAEGSEGHFTHEMIIPFVRHAKTARPTKTGAAQPRVYPPGSEWMFVKIYTGPSQVDQILIRVLRPIIQAAISDGLVDRWFFVRYRDPEFHVRVRFHGPPARIRDDLRPRIEAAIEFLIESRQSHRVLFDTYIPEILRYGGELAIETIERIFSADSEAALDEQRHAI
jgi:hypothetical protein